jgi:hypothetical protein
MAEAFNERRRRETQGVKEMEHLHIPQLVGLLVVMLAAATLRVSIECLPRHVHGFIANPENLPSDARGR